MALEIRNITDDKYGLVDQPFRVYEVPEGVGLDEYALEDYRQPLSFDANKRPLTYLQLAKNPATRKFVLLQFIMTRMHIQMMIYLPYQRWESWTNMFILPGPERWRRIS